MAAAGINHEMTTLPPPGSGRPGQRIARVVVGVLLVLLGSWILRPFLPALVWAGVFAIASWPLYGRLCSVVPERRGRWLCPLLGTLAIGVVFVVPLGFGIAEVAREARLLVRLANEVQRTGIPVPDWVEHLPGLGSTLAGWWRDNLSDPEAARALFGHASTATMVGWTRDVGLLAAQRLTVFAFMLLTLFFLFRDGRALAQRLLRLTVELLGQRGEGLAEHVVAAVHGTVNGLVLVGLGEGLVLGIAYAVLSVPHAAMLGAVTGVLAIIPFGAPVVFTSAAGVLLVQSKPVEAAVLIGFGMLVLFVADHVIRPVLIGGAVRLPFLWVLLGILGGVETFGLLGLFLGPATMAALICLWRDWLEVAPVAAGE